MCPNPILGECLLNHPIKLDVVLPSHIYNESVLVEIPITHKKNHNAQVILNYLGIYY